MSFSKKLIEQREIKLSNRLNISSLDLVLLSLHVAKVCSNTLSPHSWKVRGLNPLVGCVEFACGPCACSSNFLPQSKHVYVACCIKHFDGLIRLEWHHVNQSISNF